VNEYVVLLIWEIVVNPNNRQVYFSIVGGLMKYKGLNSVFNAWNPDNFNDWIHMPEPVMRKKKIPSPNSPDQVLLEKDHFLNPDLIGLNWKLCGYSTEP
jgi:hypothetical protein